MSSEQSSVNAQTVEQTKQQIRNLVGEIAQLSKSDVSAEEYYAAFMQRGDQRTVRLDAVVRDARPVQ